MLKQVDLKRKLKNIIQSYPKTGLYETHYPKPQRIHMFISYVHNLCNKLKNKNSYIHFEQIINEFELLIDNSDNIIIQPYNKSANHFYKHRLIKKIISNHENMTSINKAGSNYAQYKLIKTGKDVSNLRNMIVTDKKLFTIKSNLAKKYYDGAIIDTKFNDILSIQKQKLQKITILQQTKKERLKTIRYVLKNDSQYQQWCNLHKNWKMHGYDKIQEKVNKQTTINGEKNGICGLRFELIAKLKIKILLAEKYNMPINDIGTINNVNIKQIESKITGEIDIAAFNKNTKNILALIEVKHNMHDIGYADKQLQKILSIMTNKKQKYITEPNTKMLQMNKITSNTELLILTTIPNSNDNTFDNLGTSIETIRTICDLIADDTIIEKIAYDGYCDNNNYDHVWNIMMKLSECDLSRNYDSPNNMFKQLNERLIILSDTE